MYTTFIHVSHSAPLTEPLTLEVLEGTLAVSRLDAGSGLPWWAARDGGFLCLTRTAGETSVVCEEGLVPSGIRAERGFRALRVQGPLSFQLTGILASLAAPLAESRIPVFVVSTFDTDYVLVRAANLGAATSALTNAGHAVVPHGTGRSRSVDGRV